MHSPAKLRVPAPPRRRRSRPREDEEFYRAVVALRRIGKRVQRVDRDHSRLNGTYLARADLLERARLLLHPPVQLELFSWTAARAEMIAEVI
jgi:hypothetical protein